MAKCLMQVTLHARGPTSSEICPGLEGLFSCTRRVVAGKFPRCGRVPESTVLFCDLAFFSLLAPSLGSHLFPCLFLFLGVSFDLTDSIAIRLSLFNASTIVCTKCLGTRETTLIYCVREDPENVEYFTPKKKSR